MLYYFFLCLYVIDLKFESRITDTLPTSDIEFVKTNRKPAILFCQPISNSFFNQVKCSLNFNKIKAGFGRNI